MLLQEKIAQCYDNLNITDKRILAAISQNPDLFAGLTAQKAADYCSVSRATLLRAIRKAGINSFAALKYLCSASSHLPNQGNFGSALDIDRNMEAALNQLLIHSSLNKQADAILKSRKIFLYGTGNEQKSVVKYLQSRLLFAGILSQELFDEGEVEFCLHLMNEQDLFILVSLSGSSPSLMHLVNRLQIPKTMSFTRLKDNPLANACEFQLYVSTADVLNGEYELVGGFYTLVDLLCSTIQSLSNSHLSDTGYLDELPSYASSLPDDSLLRKSIIRHYHSLSPTDQHIASALIADPHSLLRLSITECAQTYHVSPSALTRFAVKLGCSGFAEMRALCQNYSPTENKDYRQEWFRDYQLMFSIISETDFRPLLAHIQKTDRIFFIALHSRYSMLASEMTRMFLPLSIPLFCYTGQQVMELLPSLITQEDTVFLLAPEGSEENTIQFLKNITLNGCYTCVLSRFESFISDVQPDLLLQAPGTSRWNDREYLGPFFVLEELLYLRCRISPKE